MHGLEWPPSAVAMAGQLTGRGRGAMTHKIQVHQVDAFTVERFTGNPAGVVLNADGLSDAQMLAIARELNNADTAFIFAPDGEGHDLRARFFTPRTEAGFVGHATVAAHYVLSRRPDAPRQLRQKSKAGIVDVEIRGGGDGPQNRGAPERAAARPGAQRSRAPRGAGRAGAGDRRPRYALSPAHRRLEQHAAADRRARPGAAEAAEARHDPPDDAVGADRRGRLLRLRADARTTRTTSRNRACSARRSASARTR